MELWRWLGGSWLGWIGGAFWFTKLQDGPAVRFALPSCKMDLGRCWPGSLFEWIAAWHSVWNGLHGPWVTMGACFGCSCPSVQGDVTKRVPVKEGVCGRYAMDLASIRSGVVLFHGCCETAEECCGAAAGEAPVSRALFPKPAPLAEQGESDLWRLVRLGEHGGTGLLQDLASCHGCGLGGDVGIGDAAKG